MLQCPVGRRWRARKAASEMPTNYTAIIHSADGIRFTAAAQRPDDLVMEVIGYIRDCCDDALWPDDARQVRQLIDDRTPYAAIALYFAKVGDRCDAEQLELGGLSFGPDLGASDSAATETRLPGSHDSSG